MCLTVGVAGGGVTAVNVRAWYMSLSPPPATPPNAVFAPVWTLLYAMMAVAAWLVWRHPDGHRRGALALWGWQLLLNAAWAPLFFGLHLILPALGVILALLVLVALTVAKFLRVDRAAALLMLPYLAWVGFAGYLNAGFWWLNR